MLLAEKHQLLLLDNSKVQAPGSAPPPHKSETHYNFQNGRGGFRGRGRGVFRRRGGQFSGRNNNGRGNQTNRDNQVNTWQKRGGSFLGKNRSKRGSLNPSRDKLSNSIQCFCCGTSGHIKRNCCTSSHLVKLYQAKLTVSKNNPQGNFLKLDEDLTAYAKDEEIPEIDMTTLGLHKLSLDSSLNCIIESGTSHSILRDQKYLTTITPSSWVITRIIGQNQLEEEFGPALVILPQRTTIKIASAIYAPTATRNLISFQDIRANNLHTHTSMKGKIEVLHILRQTKRGQKICETLPSQPPGLYVTQLQAFHTEHKGRTPTKRWHDHLGHPGMTMYKRIIRDSIGIPDDVKPSTMKNHCLACSHGNMITRPSISKIVYTIQKFLEQLTADVCGSIEPASGPFGFFLAIGDSSSKWSQISLLSTRNLVFARILANILKLRAQFPEYPIQAFRVDGAGEFTSQAFDDYCMAAGIDAQYPIPYVHFQNGIAESLIKRIQMISRPLLMQTQLPISLWGYTVLHANLLLKYRPSAFNTLNPHHLAYGLPPDVSHLKTYGCQVLVPILGPKRTNMGPHRQQGIYVGFDSPSIIRFVEPANGDVFKARF
jgi:hypothetical protein